MLFAQSPHRVSIGADPLYDFVLYFLVREIVDLICGAWFGWISRFHATVTGGGQVGVGGSHPK